MAIPLPNPNINDFDTNDVQTWSSNKLKEGFEAAGVVVDSDGYVAPKQMTLIYSETLEEGKYSIELENVNCKSIYFFIDFIPGSSGSYSHYLRIKTNSITSYAVSPAYVSKNYTADTESIVKLYVDTSKGVIDGCATASNKNGIATIGSYNASAVFDNPLADNITSVILTSNNEMPVGTVVKVYAY